MPMLTPRGRRPEEVGTVARAVDHRYTVVPWHWLATRAWPSASNSTSPAKTIATAFSTRPLHSGKVALARKATWSTAARKACRVVCSKSGADASPQLISFTATMCRIFLCLWELLDPGHGGVRRHLRGQPLLAGLLFRLPLCFDPLDVLFFNALYQSLAPRRSRLVPVTCPRFIVCSFAVC